jgi:HEAT repeat protein
MKHKRTVILLILAGILAIVTVVIVKRSSEPSFKGRTLSEWTKHRGGEADNGEAAKALRATGPKITPTLLEELFAIDSKFKLMLVQLEKNQSIFGLPFILDYERRRNARVRLRALRGEPQLEQIIPLILQRLKTTTDSDFRCDLLNTLACIGPQAKEAIPFLLTSLTNTSGNIRMFSTIALGEIGGNSERVVPALIVSLHDSGDSVRSETIRALSLFGVAAKAAIPALIEVAGKDESGFNRDEAIKALRQIEPAAVAQAEAAYLNFLIVALKDSDWHTRYYALGGVDALKQKPIAVLNAVLKGLDDEDERIRKEAISVLGSCGQQAQAALPKLRQLAVGDPDERTRQSAVFALQQIEHPGEPILQR